MPVESGLRLHKPYLAGKRRETVESRRGGAEGTYFTPSGGEERVSGVRSTDAEVRFRFTLGLVARGDPAAGRRGHLCFL